MWVPLVSPIFRVHVDPTCEPKVPRVAYWLPCVSPIATYMSMYYCNIKYNFQTFYYSSCPILLIESNIIYRKELKIYTLNVKHLNKLFFDTNKSNYQMESNQSSYQISLSPHNFSHSQLCTTLHFSFNKQNIFTLPLTAEE